MLEFAYELLLESNLTLGLSRQYADCACNGHRQSELVGHEIGALLCFERGWVVATDLRE